MALHHLLFEQLKLLPFLKKVSVDLLLRAESGTRRGGDVPMLRCMLHAMLRVVLHVARQVACHFAFVACCNLTSAGGASMWAAVRWCAAPSD